MKKHTSLILVLLLVLIQAQAGQPESTPSKSAELIPHTVEYQGTVSLPAVNNKQSDIEVTYTRQDNGKKVYREVHQNVFIRDGQFSLVLGAGQPKNGWFAKYKTLNEVFKANDKLNMSFKVADTTLYPQVALLPAGHSMESGMAIAGFKNPNELHSKGYSKKGHISAYQAAVLSTNPQLLETSSNGFARNSSPFTVKMRGPFVSKPARSLPVAVAQPFVEKEINSIRHESLFDKDGRRHGTQESKQFDELVNNGNTRGVLDPTPDPILNFAGMGNLNGVLPPDIEGAVGPNHYVQQVNLSTAVYNKAGTLVSGPFNTNQLWSGFGGSCESDNSGDAIALYDEEADRFVLSQFAVATATSVCFAVSTTPDPTGTYYLYELPAQRFPDYYKLGVWPAANNNAYFMTTNSGFAGGYDVYAIDRESLLNGTTPRTAQFFQNYYNLLMPADVDGRPPSDDAPGLLYTFRAGGENYFTDPTPVDSLDVFEYDVDWDNPANSTLTRVQEITTNDGLADFNWTVCGFFQSSCLPQPGTSATLDSGSWWPLQRLQYRNFTSHEALIGTWVVDVEAAGDRAAPRWFELNRNGGSWSIAQQGTFSPDAEHRFLSSISMDASGGIGMVFSKVSASTFASINYTARSSSDPLGQMRDEKVLIAGAGVQTSTSSRWGDYASMDVDPVDGCTFWMTSEHLPSTGGAPWATQIGSFIMPDCVSVNAADSAQSVCTANTTTADFDLTLYGAFDGSTNMGVSGCPAGASCNFSVNPVNDPADTTTLNVTGLDSAAAGSYDILATATDSISASLNNDVLLSLNLFDDVPGTSTLVSPVSNTLALTSTTLSWVGNNAQEYQVEVDDDPNFGSVDVSAIVSGTSFGVSGLNEATCYFWRVTATNLCGMGATSPTKQFYTNTTAPAGTFDSTDVPVAIGTVPVTITSELDVTGVGTITDVNVLNLAGAHTWVEDLTFTLTSPGGTSVTLMSGPCGNFDDFDINFDDEAASANFPCPPNDGQTYQPANPLSAFDGENADGTWTLTVVDAFNGDGGSLNSWSLEFESAVDPGPLTCPDLIFYDGFNIILP